MHAELKCVRCVVCNSLYLGSEVCDVLGLYPYVGSDVSYCLDIFRYNCVQGDLVRVVYGLMSGAKYVFQPKFLSM